jgi:dual specificity tyrosine-phosphorylation-regulated kinase 1
LDDKSSPGVIHCDLKPENILLRNPKRSAIKVIDFGSSCYTNDRMYTYIQSRFYRAPEVLLGLSYSHPIDMWSLGCILVELHTGEPIFSGSDEFEQVCYQTALLGQPPKNILEAGRKVKNFFSRAPNGDFVLRERKNSRGETVHYRQRHLKDILGVETGGPFGRRRDEKTGHTVSDYLRFEDLIERMLDWSAETRITPAQAMQHPFFKTEGDTMASSVASPTAAMQVMQVDDDHSTSTAATATAAHLSTPARGSAQSTPGTTPSPSSSSSVSTSLMSASAAAAAAAPHGHSTNSNAGGSTTLTNMLNAQPNFAMLPPAQQHQLVQLLIPVSQGAYLDTHTLAALPATHQAVVQQFIAEQARHRRFPAQTANAMATLLTANNGGRQSGGSGSTSGVARSRSGSGDMAS